MLIRCPAWLMRSRPRRRQGQRSALERLEKRTLLSTTPLVLAVSPQPANVTDGTIIAADEVDSYSFSISNVLGGGLLKTDIASTSGGLIPRLTLSGPNGELLIQTDSEEIAQHLEPGTYSLSISAQTGLGAYRLRTQFTPTQDPFQPPGTGKRPTLAVADVNGDGIDDLVTANYNDSSVSVLLGAGDGSFQAIANFPVDSGPLGVAAADLNGDGFADIVTGNYLTSGTVSVLIGKGDGTFKPVQNFTTGDGALFPEIADVNGDGRPDIITGNYRAGTISVLLGNDDGTGKGDGTFRTLPEMVVGAYPAFVSAADVNGDGKLDIVSPNGSDSISVLLNLGNNAVGEVIFAPQLETPTTAFPFAVGIADFNGDGRPDLVSAHRNDDSVRLQLGAGNGTFGAEVSFAVGDTPYAMVVADLNGDGRPDVAVANRDAGTVSVLLSKGDGTFQPQVTLPVGQRPLTIRAADVNHDGHTDILAANADDNTVSILLGRGDGSFSFPAGATAAAGKRPFLFAIGDLRGDGHADIVTGNSSNGSLSVLLGATGGSFQPHRTLDVGDQPIGVAMADFNGDGKLDLVVTNKADNTVGVLLALGGGDFGPETTFDVGAKPLYVVTEDLDGDGDMDIVVTNNTGTSVSVLLGDGVGSFATQQELATGATTYGVAVADINGDGKPDIVVSNYAADSISVLLGNGNGTFQDQQVVRNVGSLPSALALGLIDDDFFLDIVVALGGDNKVAVLTGNGDGTFNAPRAFGTGGVPTGVALAHFDNDGFLDVVVSNRADNSVSVLRGNGDGTFQIHQSYNVGRQPFSVAATDVTGDGRPDIITANASDSTVSVLVGNGDGTFHEQSPFALGKRPYTVVVADVSGDGNPDTITANYNAGTVSVARGNGNGSFQTPESFSVGSRPLAVALADLNHDGRSDLVTANSADGSVSVLLGNGDGTFQPQQAVSVGQRPAAVKVVDINGDGHLDLVVGNYDDDSVSVLLGRGDGSFQAQQAFSVGNGPNALSASDLNGDNKIDVVVTNIFDNSVSVLFNTRNGIGSNVSFQPQTTFAVGVQPYDVAIADVDGDGKPDLVTANYGGNSVSVLRGDGTGSFGPQEISLVGERPVAVAVADVDGDGQLDLVATNRRDGTLSILQNNGGNFTLSQTLDAGAQPISTAVTNVNGDGRPSIVTVNYSNSTPRVLLASTSSFNPATPGNATESLNNTALADLTGDGVQDTVILDASGNVLFRRGLAGNGGGFVPPVILNADRRARDVVVVNIGSGLRVAVADSSFDPARSAAVNQFVYTVSLYGVSAGSVLRTTAFTSLLLPTRIVAGDLTGDGRDDIVVANSLDNSIQVSFQRRDGSFSAPLTLTTGEAPSNLVLVDVNGDGLSDIVVTDQASGDVSVFLNDSSHTFGTSLRYRAGNGLFGLDTTRSAPAVTSDLQSVSLAVADFTGDGRKDLVVVNRSAHSFSVLPNTGYGGFANPRLSLTTSTSDGFDINNQPGAIVAGDFNRDGHQDLTVLMKDTGELWIFRGHGDGTFEHSFTIPVGNQATGLALVPGATGNGLLDLLVGNGFGDVLRLVGRGDGTFQIQGNRVSLSVVPDLFGPGLAGVLVGNQQGNRVTVQTQTADGNGFETVDTLGEDNAAQLAPGDVQFTRLARNATLPDAVVVSTGGNAVIVYHTIAIANGAPVFAPEPQTFFVGTAPASATVADINGDGIADMLIANRGSNDVSVLFGSYGNDGAWVGVAGPRLRSGGAGPISVAVRELTGDSVLDLVVINGQSGKLTVLPGVGQGFFDDRSPQTLLNFGTGVVEPPSFVGTSDLGFAVTTDGKLLQFDLSDVTSGGRVVFSAEQVLSARALPNGQVVVVVVGGSVKVLKAVGDMFIVESVLEAQGGVPVLPSSLAVLQTSGGQFQVLVSSQGSDTVSVFAAGRISQPSFVSITPVIASQAGALSAGSASFIFNLFGTGGFSLLSPINSGLSLSGFSSLGSLSFSDVIGAALVAVEGDEYSNVPVLDFGSQKEDLAGDGRGRKPELSLLYSFGDTSPATRFVIGLDDAIEEFRLDALNSPLTDESEAASSDPWTMDLLQPQPKARRTPRADEPDTEGPTTDDDLKDKEDRKSGKLLPNREEPEILESRFDRDSFSNEQLFSDSYWQQYSHDDDHWVLSSAGTSPSESDSVNSTALLAGMLLLPLSIKDSDKLRHRSRSDRSAGESRR